MKLTALILTTAASSLLPLLASAQGMPMRGTQGMPMHDTQGMPMRDTQGTSNGQGQPFMHMDSNNDGKITREEAEAACARRTARLFEQADTDKDGVLTKEELSAHRKQMQEERPRDRMMGQPRSMAPAEDNK